MATSPSNHTSGFLSPLKSKLANRLSGNFHRKSYNQFESSPSVEDFNLQSSPKIEQDPQFFDFSTVEINSLQPTHNDYLFTKDNYFVFYIQFTRVECGLFKDLINLNAPVQEVIDRYSKFFYGSPKLKLFTGPKIGVSHRKFYRTHSLTFGSTKISSSYSKLSGNSSFAEQNITSSHLLIISAPSEAKFNRELLRAYIDSKSEQTQFVERWLPAVQGAVPLSEDTACVVAASLHTLNGKQSPSVRASPRDFVHRAVPLSKLAGTKIERVLEDIKLESVESIRKLCVDAILSNYLSAAIVFSVANSTSLKKDAYFVISPDSVGLIKKSNLSRITPSIKIKDIIGWVPDKNILDVEYVNRVDITKPLQFQIKSNDTFIISDTLRAVGHAFVTNK